MRIRLLTLVLVAAGCGESGSGEGETTDTGSLFGGSATGGAVSDGGPQGGAPPVGGDPASDGGPLPGDMGLPHDGTLLADVPSATGDMEAVTADAAVACPDGGCPPNMGDCMVDTDCPGSRSCVDGACAEPAVCFSPDDCDAPRVCSNAECAAPCGEDADCAGGRVCDVETGGCVAPPMCVEDAQCPGTRICVLGQCPEPEVCFSPDDCDAGRACREGTCESACSPQAPCAGRLICDPETSLCQEGDDCEDAEDCLGARVCNAGVCADGCVDDSACTGTRHCDLATGLCPEPLNCFVPADCDEPRSCTNGRCAETCGDVEACPGRLVCDPLAGICIAPDVCEADADCPNAVCDAGECHPPCASDPECGGALTCDVETGHCSSPPGCTVDGDCSGLEICGADGVCFRPECEINADCPGACVDRLCVDAPPVGCGVESPCPQGQTCAPLGVCVLDGACEADDQCPEGAPRCDTFDGRCVGCLGDLDCAAAESCQAGSCQLAGGICLDEADCPGDRTCMAGLCVAPAGCDGDAFDLEPVTPQLVTRTYADLVLCDGDEDVYEVAVPAGEGLQVLLRHDPAVGDLSLTLDDPFALPPLSVRSDLQEGLEIVGTRDGPMARSVTLRVQGRAGRSVPYTLTVERLEAGLCVPDPLEGVLGNDDAEHAHPVDTGSTEVELCPGDEDWLALDLPAGVHVTIRGTTLSAGAEVEMTLNGPGGARIGRENATDAGVELGADLAAGGRHLLQLRGVGEDTRTRLRLEISLFATTEAAACGQALVIQPGPALALPHGILARRFSVGCGLGTDADLLLSFTLAGPSVVDLSATGTTAITIRGTCADPASEIACEASQAQALRGVQLDAGTFFVILKVAAEARPTVTFSSSGVCARDADCGANGLCVDGACQPRCVRDADCLGTQTCEVATGRCRESGRCASDEDCVGGRLCRFDGTCFVPDCAENEDCQGGACVDEVCAPAAPAACDADADCGGRQLCAPVGACIQDGPCGNDADCPAGTPVCDVATTACTGCLADADCQNGEACRAGRCEYLGACDGPGDCPGTRICGNDHLCNPAPGCLGDRFDGQEPPATLSARTYSGLVLCDGTQDRFFVQPRAGEGVRVTLRHDPALGDLALDLSALPPLLDRYGSSDGRLGVETVLLPSAMLVRPAQLTVQGRPGATVPYSLTIERTEAGLCGPDPLEGVLGNDTLATAVPLITGAQTVSLCPDDEDWFALRVAAGTRFTASVAPADVLLSLHEPNGDSVADGVASAGRTSLSGEFLAPAVTYLRLAAPDGESRASVDLQIEAVAVPGAEALACAAPLALVPNQVLAPPDTLRVARFTVPCSFPFPGLTGDFVARFVLNAPATVTLLPSDGSAVALRRDCDDPASQTLCALAGAPELVDVALAAGTWFVVVQAFSPAPPQLRMTVR